MLADIRFALRSYGRSPGFAAVAVAALVLGIGANTAMFSALDAVLLRQLPYKDPSRIVMLWESNPKVGGFLAERLPVAFFNLQEWKRQSRLLEDLGYFQHSQMNITGQDRPEQVEGVFASTNFLDLLGVSPVLGRGFTASDAPQGRGQVAIISYALYDRRFAKDRSIIGKPIRVDDVAYTVIGVLPPGFHLPAMWEGFDQKKPDVWMTMSAAGLSDAQLQGRVNFVYARMKPGVTVNQLRAEMASIGRGLLERYPKLNQGFGVSVFPLSLEDIGPVLRRTVVVLQFAVAFVLLIACANVANLLLARAVGRDKEIAIRVALGAGRWRVVRQMLAESLLLSGVGALGGTALAWGCIQAIKKVAPPGSYHLQDLTLDWKVLAFTLGASLFTGLAFGLAPAIRAARQNINESLVKAGRWGGSGASGRLRDVLVVSEVALALVLLVGAGLMIRSMTSLLSVPAGFATDHLLTAHVRLTADRYKDPRQVKSFSTALLDRVSRIAGVKSVAIADGLPMLDSIQAVGLHLEGQTDPVSLADYVNVSDGYFETLRAPILQGRSFTRADADRQTPEVAIVNETLGRAIAPHGSPLGKVVLMGGNSPRLVVVGVKADTHQMGLDTPTRPELLLPSRSIPAMALIVATEGDPMRVADSLRSAVWSIDGNQPVADVMSMAEEVGQGVQQRKFNTVLFGVFAGLALLLASVGIYGVLAYAVSQKTREYGIRMALGAQPGSIAGLVLRQGLARAGIGVAIGAGAAYGVTRWMQSLIFGISPTDPLTFSIVAAVLVAIAMAASYLPARRATRVDPMTSLRVE